VLVICVIMDAGPVPLPGWLVETLIWACLATILVSGVQYVWVWWAKARAHGWREE
jgi:cardiolipin synthase